MPVDVKSRSQCQIGGNLSTNAVGTNLIKHNSIHANCIGLKLVLPSGEILDNMTTLRKDNTGYDLKHLFIGAEGTLGIITECSVLCSPLPKSTQVALVASESFSDVERILHRANQNVSDILYSYEHIDRELMQIILTGKEDMFPKSYPFYSLIEFANYDEEDNSERVQRFIGKIKDNMLDHIIP